MKVGLFVGAIRSTDGGGYTYVVELLAALRGLRERCGHELVICYRRGGEEVAGLFPGFAPLNLDDLEWGVLSLKEKLFRPLPKLVQCIFDTVFRVPKALPPEDRIYAREGIQFLIRLVPWHATSLNVPFGAILWDLQHRNNPWFPEVSVLSEWNGREVNYSLLLRRASVIYSGTARGRQEIVSFYQVPEERVEVLPFPTPTFTKVAADTARDPETAARHGIPADYLFYPAQFWPHKNHVVVLEACRLVRTRTGWDLGVVFVGADKGNRDYVHGYAQSLGLAQSTRFLGFVDQAELVQLYKNAFCLVYATFAGPDNLPPLEAFALGCPVIASAVPGAAEQLGDAGLLFQPDDEQALAEAIVSLREPDLRGRLIAAGHVRAARDNWDGYAAGMIRSVDKFARIRRAWH